MCSHIRAFAFTKCKNFNIFTWFFKILTQDYVFIDFFLKEGYWGRVRDRETSMWELNIDSLPPMCTLMGDWTRSLNMCLDWELNIQPFGVQGDIPTNWATWPGVHFSCIKKRNQLKFAYELMNISTIWNGNFLSEDLWIFILYQIYFYNSH